MTARFDFTTPAYRLRTRGVAHQITPTAWEGSAVADAVARSFEEAGNRASAASQTVVVGAIPFDPCSPAMLYIPEEVEWGERTSEEKPSGDTEAGGVAALQFSRTDSPAYRSAVDEAVRRIGAGDLEKVVLARRLTVEAEETLDPDTLYARLVARNPSAYVYRLDLPGDEALLGASPELVLASRGGHVESRPLAGSVPRASDPHADQEIARRLLGSSKELAEHAHVTHAVGEAFHRFADDVVLPEHPSLVHTPVIWHLGTQITGRLREGVSPIELAYALHPTPAVCGWPTETAREAIAELEDFERGLYAGLIGWMDADGTGEWALTLRGGTVNGKRAELYAGAGIVAGSDPESEHTETAVKFRTFASALGIVDEARPGNPA